MYIIYLNIRDNKENILSGYYAGMKKAKNITIPLTREEEHPEVKLFPTRRRAELAGKIAIQNCKYISGYKVQELKNDSCNDFECSIFQTAECPNFEGCIGCDKFASCKNCTTSLCINQRIKRVLLKTHIMH